MSSRLNPGMPPPDQDWLDALELRPVSAQGLGQQVLRTDASGMPLEWIDYREAVRLHCLDQVAYARSARAAATPGTMS